MKKQTQLKAPYASVAKKKKAASKPAIAFFPFLYLDKPLDIADISLRPAKKSEVEKERKIVQTALVDLADCFRLYYEGRLPCWSFIVTHVRNEKEWLSLKQKLDKLTCILRYIKFSTPRIDAFFSHIDQSIVIRQEKLGWGYVFKIRNLT